MIKAKIFKCGKLRCGFDVSGHSGYADSGADIVCAAVSSVVGFVEAHINDTLKAGLPVTVEPENARVAIELPVAQAEAYRDILTTFEEYIRELAGEYPKYIEVLEVQLNA